MSGGDFFDFMEAHRIALAYAHDPNFAVSLSGVRGLPHQITAVYRHMPPQARLRFVLADDPGAGKTIMAGLLIKELRLRAVADRVLVLCPAPLTVQWKDELHEKFDEDFAIIDSHSPAGSRAATRGSARIAVSPRSTSPSARRSCPSCCGPPTGTW